jgi:hypothetical protein
VLFTRLFDGQLQTQKSTSRRADSRTTYSFFLFIPTTHCFTFNVRHPRTERVLQKHLYKKNGWHLASRFFNHFMI